MSEARVGEQAIKERIAARQAASTVANLILDEAIHCEQRTAYFRELLKQLRGVIPKELWPATEVQRDKAMTNKEGRRFEAEPMPFGQHMDTLIGEVPIDYLEWLDEQPDFRRELNRYLRGRLKESP